MGSFQGIKDFWSAGLYEWECWCGVPVHFDGGKGQDDSPGPAVVKEYSFPWSGSWTLQMIFSFSGTSFSGQGDIDEPDTFCEGGPPTASQYALQIAPPRRTPGREIFVTALVFQRITPILVFPQKTVKRTFV